MHSLYWRIFLAFWVALALILVGTVTVAVNATAHRADRPGLQRGQLYAQAARAFETGGPAALEDWLRSLPAEPLGRTFIIEPGGREMLRRPLPPSSSGANDAERAAGKSRGAAPAPGTAAGAIAPLGGALELVAPGGSTYRVVVAPHRPRLFGELELPGVPLALLAIALGVSGAVCYFLARYLAAPVDRLRLATRQLAAGDLNVRVLPALKGRQDDLGLLAADLDSMAERLRLLLEAKQQLLRDVSHELRSPLARLQLALSGDPELLRSAFENVIRNAVRFSPARGAVVVSARRRPADDRPQGGLIDVIVRDHGPGVPEKDLGLIFEPFYRVDAARGHDG